MVAFRDPYLAEQKPEWSLHVADGSIYRDNKGLAWVNPYKKEVWDYLIEVSKKASEMGFKLSLIHIFLYRQRETV